MQELLYSVARTVNWASNYIKDDNLSKMTTDEAKISKSSKTRHFSINTNFRVLSPKNTLT